MLNLQLLCKCLSPHSHHRSSSARPSKRLQSKRFIFVGSGGGDDHVVFENINHLKTDFVKINIQVINK